MNFSKNIYILMKSPRPRPHPRFYPWNSNFFKCRYVTLRICASSSIVCGFAKLFNFSRISSSFSLYLQDDMKRAVIRASEASSRFWKGGSQIALSVFLCMYVCMYLCMYLYVCGQRALDHFWTDLNKLFLIDRYRPCLELNFVFFRNLHFSEYFGHITVFISTFLDCLRSAGRKSYAIVMKFQDHM